jgi:hypothetical protein
VVSGDVLTGEESARLYSEALGRRVRYAGDDLEAFTRRLARALPGWLLYDVALMYARFQQDGLPVSAQDLHDAEAIVGHPPRRYRDFVREVAAG